MTTQATTNTENKDRVREAFETVGKIAETGIDITALKKRVEYAVEDAIIDAQRIAKHGKYAAEDIVEDTTHYIKKNPWQSIGYAAGAGLGVGLIVGWLMTRGNSRSVN